MQKQNRTCEFDGDLTWIWNRLKKQQNQTLRSEALPKDKKLNRSNNPLGPWENLGKRMKAWNLRTGQELSKDYSEIPIFSLISLQLSRRPNGAEWKITGTDPEIFWLSMVV